MRKYLYVLLFMIITITLKCQIIISLDTLKLSSISFKCKNGFTNSDLDRNPYAIFCITLKNNTNKVFQINHSNNTFYYTYYFNDEIHISNLFLWTNSDDPIFIEPHDSIQLNLEEFRFAYKVPYNDVKRDYHKEFASIIPTIKAIYILQDCKIIESNPLKIVKIPKKYFVENKNIVYGHKNLNFYLWIKYLNLTHKNKIMHIIFY